MSERSKVRWPPVPALIVVMALALGLAVPSAVLAQPAGGVRRSEGGPPGAMFDFLGVRDAFDGKVVKGVPYKAEAVTEVVQAMADGNRIARKSTA